MFRVATAVPAAAGTTIDLHDSWGKLWGAVTAGFPQLPTILTVVGLILLVSAFLKYLWDRRRGQGGNHHPVIGAMCVGAVFAAPAFLLPVVLTLLDGVMNIAANLFSSVSS